MRYFLVCILTLVFLISHSCSKEKSTSRYCEEFTRGKIENVEILINRRAAACFRNNLSHPQHIVREHSVRGIAETGTPNDITLLHAALLDGNYAVSIASARILAKTNIKVHIERVVSGLAEKRAHIRRACIYALLEIKNCEKLDMISGMLNDAFSDVRIAAALYITALSASQYAEKLKASLLSETDAQAHSVKTECLKLLLNSNQTENDR